MKKRPRVGKADRSRWQTWGSKIFSEQEWAKIGRSLKLSGRELQLVRGMFDDSTDFAIADDLGISPHTVHTHCKRSYHKLGVTDDTFSNHWRLPDPERCLTKHLGYSLDFSDCLVKNPYACEYAVRFGSGVFCNHPERRSFELAAPPLMRIQ